VALSVSHYGYVLERGMIVLEGEVNFLQETPHIKHAYLGI